MFNMTMLGLLLLIVSALAYALYSIFCRVTFVGAYSLWKMSPFECGFSPWENSRQSFSLQFFLISLIFLIFDVELMIIFPMVPVLHFFSLMTGLLSFFVFFGFMVFGLILEWGALKLDWSFY